MYSFWDLPHPSKGLKPVKKMFLQEAMHLVIVPKLTATPLQVLGPVKTSVLHFGRKTALSQTAFNVGCKHAGSIHATDVSL
jgi:hypothetical protein